jgi:hypothetical protein
MYDMFVEPDLDQQPKWDGGSKANEEPLSRRARHNKKGGHGEEDVNDSNNGGGGGGGGDLWLHEDANGVTQVKNLSVIEAVNEEDALTLLYTAASTRTISSHAMNARSSRAHFILTIHVAIKQEGGGDEPKEEEGNDDASVVSNNPDEITVAKLHLVDLAGSERVERTNSVGLVMREVRVVEMILIHCVP